MAITLITDVGLKALKELMMYDKSVAGCGVSHSGLTQATMPQKPMRNLIESRNSLADGLDHLVGTINLLDSLLDTIRGPQNAAGQIEGKEAMPSGPIQVSLDFTADLYERHLNRLRRRVEELDSLLGAGFCSPQATTGRG